MLSRTAQKRFELNNRDNYMRQKNEQAEHRRRHPSHFSKLNEEQVKVIRKRLEKYYRGLYQELAYEYNVSPTTIVHIRDRRTWRDV
jgi:ClpP class serine protease